MDKQGEETQTALVIYLKLYIYIHRNHDEITVIYACTHYSLYIALYFGTCGACFLQGGVVGRIVARLELWSFFWLP